MKKILLARPSIFIVKEMRRLLEDMHYAPTLLNQSADASNHTSSSVGGAVISTALNSIVKEDYAQVTKELKQKDATLPILVATLVPFNDIVKALKLKFSSLGLNMNFFSIQDASKQLRLNPVTDILIIHRNDLVEHNLYETTKRTIRAFFR